VEARIERRKKRGKIRRKRVVFSDDVLDSSQLIID
jgi:hypothetical protein